jgi:hypothetical protein
MTSNRQLVLFTSWAGAGVCIKWPPWPVNRLGEESVP